MEKINFDKHYNFDNFIVGNSNRFAFSLAVDVAKDSSRIGNVVFLYSKNGLGKTHLMHAIGNEILATDSSKKVLYITSENFINELKDCIGDLNYKDELFIKKYNDLDVLLIDDIHFLSGKKIVQEAFFNIFNTLYQNGKRIILSSDRPPRDMDFIDKELKSCFECGLIADISMPDYELKFSILKGLVKREKLDIDTKILQKIANFNDLTIRNLTGIINQIQAYSTLNNCSVSIEIVDSILNTYK